MRNLIRLISVALISVTLSYGCADESVPVCDYAFVTYNDVMIVFDRVGRNNPVRFKQICDDRWLITFRDGTKLVIRNDVKKMIETTII